MKPNAFTFALRGTQAVSASTPAIFRSRKGAINTGFYVSGRAANTE
jgi:hypothetical protein